MSLPAFAYPGLPLGPASAFAPGSGTYVHNDTVRASTVGRPKTTSTRPHTVSIATTAAGTRIAADKTSEDAEGLGSQNAENAIHSRNVTRRNILPRVGAVVLARVTRLQTSAVGVAILVVDNVVCADAMAGTIRREDVRSTEIDKVQIETGFRIGDIVRAIVISIGDRSAYYLSTARNELGVLLATSDDGYPMEPISWKEFRDPVTGKIEARKVAKPV